MSYNNKQFQAYVNTAGKITIITAFLGVVVFTLIFLLNIGAKELKQATAQGVATTSVTVLNTPPAFSAGPFESPESSTSSPTNAGDVVSWIATAIDPSGDDYYLLVCDGETASPTANAGSAPTCDGADTTWGVSAIASSGVQASVSTTTQDAFVESNVWFAWVCDDVAINPRCQDIASQGTGSTSSPFNVNHRPTFIGYWDDSPADPSDTVIFYATSTDPDSTGAQDTVSLYVCDTNSFNSTSSLGCNGNELGSTTVPVATNATATYAIPSIIQDDDYPSYGFVVDSHGFESVGAEQGTDSILTVNNVAPSVLNGTIDLITDGGDITLTEGIENTGFTLDFVVTDANSCDAVGGSGPTEFYDEYSTTTISVYRSGIGSTTCSGDGIDHDPNECYESGIGVANWNLQCTASSTTCTPGGGDDTMLVECTFPIWFVADPTNGADASSSVYFAQDWRAGVSATDDDNATSTFTESTGSNPDVIAVVAINLLDSTIPYGSLEPGNDTGTLSASTTSESTGNTGLDESLEGEDMCDSYQTGSECSPIATSTIPASEQEFGTSTLAYGSGVALSSTSPATLDLNIPKTTSTTTPNNAETFWGIAVPAAITLSGAYTGENTFTAVMSDPSQW